MKCEKALDMIYGAGEPPPLAERLALALHILFCGRCALALEHCRDVQALLEADIPPCPDFTGVIMAKICMEDETGETVEDEIFDIPGGFSTGGWVAAGFVTLFSLATAFFGKDFLDIAGQHGSSFLLPLGIVIGFIISAYGVLFIGSHLKEFSERFHLR